MPDIIQLLPDNIANQIAAGEVIQRPASAVKELLENAIDAGGTEIRLIIAEAGKSLIQVIDNGRGMSETDARMAFERHATSKIRHIEDLFRIRTMGFRGEALASIAAVSQVELKTRRAEDEIGTAIEIENSAVRRQEPVAAPVGTSIAMKNLFFNVPARRNFLKSHPAEMRHIIEEFTRVALAFPAIFFSLHHNGQEMMHLEKGSLKQRILQVLGSTHNAKLVAVQENTDYLNIYGFVGKPEAAKKTRGDQYFFVNSRYIRSAYLNHAVMSAYREMIPSDSFPLYTLFIDLDPAHVDINVHPTKQEIKFEDEKVVYAFVQAAVKHALAQFSVTPTLDFDLDPHIQGLDAVSKPVTEEKRAEAASGRLYEAFSKKNQAHLIEPENKSELKHWREFYEGPPSGGGVESGGAVGMAGDPAVAFAGARTAGVVQPVEGAELQQLMNTYIVTPTNRGFVLVHQQSAHERVVYERLAAAAAGKGIAAQQSMFPVTLQLSPQDAALLSDLQPDLLSLGYQIEPFGKNAFIVQGTPADLPQGNEAGAVEGLLEQFKHFTSEIKFSRREKLLRSMAWQQAVKPGAALDQSEMRALVDGLFACEQPNVTPSGQPTYIEFRKEYVEKLFGK
ncbi:MAG: DNA mismatch repair endonuclease MutL [Bacteroidota bacterium]|nr:DNA mismatch repair endonuclease MutL [Bacteroidota bacterium]MDP4244777.1 DNA mismatch repair endonuclease MutL [Bacteroidota bacterium]MDP4253868.1 DNA mismatch repair endonuclease MutL [Bacteroidota bacterium]MDP4258229.1 DNA mismatch repair endonuclease MutL [Bacteroidota bacterium]